MKKRTRFWLAGAAVCLAAGISVPRLLGSPGSPVRVISPAPGARLQGTVAVLARADLDELAYLIFVVDADRPFSTNARPLRFVLDTTSLVDGPHTISVEAYSRYGLIGSSQPIKVFVTNNAPQMLKAPARVARRGAAPSQRVPAPAAVTAKPAPVAPAAAVQPPDAEPAAKPVVTPPSTMRAAQPAAVAVRAAPRVQVNAVPAPKPAPAALREAAVPPSPKPTPVAKEAPEIHRTGPAVLVIDGHEIGAQYVDVRSGQAVGPLRAMVEKMGGKAHWISKDRSAIALRAGRKIAVKIGSRTATVNGKQVELATAAYLRHDRTWVPVRIYGLAMGASVAWNGSERRVEVLTYDLHTTDTAMRPIR